jgi:ribosome biogenesis GTPase / thiamine phosphate phosphatase
MTAEVIATFGRHMLLRDESGHTHPARPQGRSLDIVCGDRVVFENRAGDEWLVIEVRPRQTLMRRSNQRGRSETLVANLSMVAVVVAPTPLPDLFMVDRYLCAARCAGLKAVIVVNKCDTGLDQELTQGMQVYRQLGYQVQEVSARSADGCAVLAAMLQNNTSVLLGQSGVGKSSLINRLAATGVDALIGELMRDEEGRHTTTASRLYDCQAGGRLIDSPGVRDYAPAIDDLDRATLGFDEADKYAGQCRFHDCQHMSEPQCAMRTAVDSGEMDPRRYESYRRLRRLFNQLWKQRPAGERAAR